MKAVPLSTFIPDANQGTEARSVSEGQVADPKKGRRPLRWDKTTPRRDLGSVRGQPVVRE